MKIGKMRNVSNAFAAVFFLAAILSAQSIPKEMGTVGPLPPPGVKPKTGIPAGGIDANPKVIPSVPGYLWHHGCTPTALGMVIGFYDYFGFGNLVTGSAQNQTVEVNNMIASEGSKKKGIGRQRHYEDYSLPKDTGNKILKDNSEFYPSKCHPNDCVADFLHTSWSRDGLAYGWTYLSRIGDAFKAFVKTRDSTYKGFAYHYYPFGGSLSDWRILVREIDYYHPVVLAVDSDGDGVTDHSVTVIGYNVGPNNRKQYGCLDTWAPAGRIRWCEFRPVSKKYSWGVSSAWVLHIKKTHPYKFYYAPDSNPGTGRNHLIPFGWTYGDFRYQQIIPKRYLPSSPGHIRVIGYAPSSTKSVPCVFDYLVIKLGHNNSGKLGSKFENSYSGLPTTVFNRKWYKWYVYKDTWSRIVLDRPFWYNGKDNLVVDLAFRENGNSSFPGFHRGFVLPRCYSKCSFKGSSKGFGAGCRGSNWKTPSISDSGVPMIGSGLFSVNLSGAVPNAPCILFFGLNNSKLGPFSLPLDLGLFGAKGCLMYSDVLGDWVQSTNSRGEAGFPINFPPSAQIAGLPHYFQWMVLDSGANQLGLVLSSGLKIVPNFFVSGSISWSTSAGLKIEIGF